MKHTLAALMALACTACAAPMVKVSQVTPAGSGDYLIRGTPTDGMDWGEIRATTLSAADKFCTDRGGQMQQVTTSTHGTRHWGQQELELTFRCAAAKKA
jgi:putative hemolysin